jgi:putative CocE/NonD family hydrolase
MPERVVVERELAVAARDGVRLAADVYRPAGDGPFPTLVTRVRGSRSSAFIVGLMLINPLEAVRHGYAVVVQEVRGRSGSEARWHPFVHERSDGEDFLEWLLGQPWCDGRVGAYGTAYSAETALALSTLGREELRALAVLGTGADYHDGWVYTNGVFELGWNVYWAYMTLTETIGRLDVDEATRAELRREHARAIIDAPGIAARLPISDHPLLERGEETQYHEWLAHPDYDDYWRSVDVLDAIDRLRAPILSITGWHDNFLKSHFDLYRAVTAGAPEPGRSHHRLIVGPWEHANYVSPFSTSRTGAVEFGPEAACGVGFSAPLLLDWFDRWVKGQDRGPEGGVRYWQLGEDAWRDAPAWPPPHAEQRWHLRSGGRANTRDGDGVLALEPPAGDEPADSYLYDPLDPAPTVGGKTLMPTIMGAGIEDQGEVEDRPDVLCYTSDALPADYTVLGPVSVTLFAASSAPDTDWVARLVDVYPDGRAMIVADGIVRASARESYPAPGVIRPVPPCPIEPGRVYEYAIDLWAAGLTFLAGHRLRVEIASSCFPRWDRNLQTGQDGMTSAETAVARQQVFHDAARPSRITLSVVAD